MLFSVLCGSIAFTGSYPAKNYRAPSTPTYSKARFLLQLYRYSLLWAVGWIFPTSYGDTVIFKYPLPHSIIVNLFVALTIFINWVLYTWISNHQISYWRSLVTSWLQILTVRLIWLLNGVVYRQRTSEALQNIWHLRSALGRRFHLNLLYSTGKCSSESVSNRIRECET